jgi:hypothetical protein
MRGKSSDTVITRFILEALDNYIMAQQAIERKVSEVSNIKKVVAFVNNQNDFTVCVVTEDGLLIPNGAGLENLYTVGGLPSLLRRTRNENAATALEMAASVRGIDKALSLMPTEMVDEFMLSEAEALILHSETMPLSKLQEEGCYTDEEMKRVRELLARDYLYENDRWTRKEEGVKK